MNEVRSACGWCVAHTLHDVYNMGKSLQHRGRDTCGFAGISDKRIDVATFTGEVDNVDLSDLGRMFDSNCHTFLFHNRYGTVNRKSAEQMLSDAHPIAIGGELQRYPTHQITRNARVVGVINGNVSEQYLPKVDPSLLRTGSDSELLLHLYDQFGEGGLLSFVPGAYTGAIANINRNGVIVLRDRSGIKPGVMGEKDHKIIAASEDLAIIKNGGDPGENINPGSVYYISSDGRHLSVRKFSDSYERYCFFEWIYIANVDSIVQGISVREIRRRIGTQLAIEQPIKDADIITYVPRCPQPAAESYAATLDMRENFTQVFYKINSKRSFIGPDAEERKISIRGNLYLHLDQIDSLRGKKVVVIDDSIIRGNNSVHARELLYDVAKVSEAILLSYTPKIGIIGDDGIERGCEFGVDMPPQESPPNHTFISRTRKGKNRSDLSISRLIGMETRYLSYDGLINVFNSLGMPENSLCTFCIGGNYPLQKTNFVIPTISATNHM